jgi:hypothetical protein
VAPAAVGTSAKKLGSNDSRAGSRKGAGVVPPAVRYKESSRRRKGDTIPDQARAILEKAEQMEPLSLHPDRPQEKPEGDFHGWKVLGETVVKDAETRKKLVAASARGVQENGGKVALCFNPRHGIRATHDGKTADFVICFECFHGHTYVGDNLPRGFLTTGSPEKEFDKVLTDAKDPPGREARKGGAGLRNRCARPRRPVAWSRFNVSPTPRQVSGSDTRWQPAARAS